MNYTWNWGVLWQSTGVGDSTYLSWILIGLGWLVVIAIVAWSIAMVHGHVQTPFVCSINCIVFIKNVRIGLKLYSVQKMFFLWYFFTA
jgi:hypothetical protein